MTCTFACVKQSSYRRSYKNENKLARSFNFTFRSIDEDLSLNNSKFGDLFIMSTSIELEIKDSTYTARSDSYLNLHLEIDSKGQL